MMSVPTNPLGGKVKKFAGATSSGPFAPKPTTLGGMPQAPTQPGVTQPHSSAPTTPGWNAYKPSAPPAETQAKPPVNPNIANYVQKQATTMPASPTPAPAPVSQPTAATTQPTITMSGATSPKPAAEPVSAPAATQTTTMQADSKPQVTPDQPQQAPEQQAPFQSTSGNNVKSYIDKTSATLGQDPGYTTDAGKLYADRTTNALKTPDAASVSAQQTEDTGASRRQYMANMQTQEALGQSHFAPGSAQAQRAMDRSQAGVNSANQAGQNSVNSFVRQRTEDNMNRAQGLETQQYNKGRDNLGDAQGQAALEYNQNEKATDRSLAAKALEYSHGRDAVGDARTNRLDTNAEAQQAVENKVVKDGQDATAQTKIINSLPDGPAKNAVTAGLANGSMDLKTALDKVMNPDGTIKPEFAGKTPGALGLEAEKTYAGQTAEMEGLKPGTPEYDKRVAEKVLEIRTAKENPITDETKAKETAAIKEKLDTGTPITDPKELKKAVAAGLIPPLSLATIPAGAGNVNAFLKQNPSGQFAIGKDTYTLVKGSSPRTGYEDKVGNDFWGVKVPRHTDVAEVKDSSGATKYYYGGTIHDTPPKTV